MDVLGKNGSKSEPLFYCDLNASKIKFKKFYKIMRQRFLNAFA